ncbi:MAG: hypothetical protein JXM70_03620 [Pirellulales bacterium]|nr:hypothetical protein [Pirellulales bacterium]
MISFTNSHCPTRSSGITGQIRKGAIAVLAAILLIFLLAMVAFVVDIGYLVSTRAEMQRTADAAALAGAWEMLGDEALTPERVHIINYAARTKAAEVASLNKVIQTNPSMGLYRDIDIGYLSDPTNRYEWLKYDDPLKYNTVQVRLRYDGDLNQSISLFFAPVLGIDAKNMHVHAAASFTSSKTTGFRITPNTENCTLMPFAVKLQDWLDLLAGTGEDNWSHNSETGEVTAGSDGIRELKMYPEKDLGWGIVPGNFGTVDVGDPNNAAETLVRQILDGVSTEDLSYYPNGELKLDPETGELILNGDTGLSTTIKSALEEVIGKPRSICLYVTATDQGNTTDYTIVGFAGIRVVDVQLTGNDKYVLVQPGMVADSCAILGNNDTSYFLGPPVFLIR